MDWIRSWAASWFETAEDARTLVTCGPGFIGQLCAAVRSQQQNASSPIAHAGQHGGPEIMVNAPANNLGARYRAAYWLFVASRIALGRQNETQAASLRVAALAELNRAEALTGSRSVFTWLEDPSGTSKLRSTLHAAEKKARGAGIADVADVLRLQQQKAAIQAQQGATAGQGAFDMMPVSGSTLAKAPTVIAGTSAVVVGSLVLGGLLWFVWPWISPAVGAGRAALRTRRSRSQRNRKRRARR